MSFPSQFLFLLGGAALATLIVCGAEVPLHAQESTMPASTEEIIHVLNRTSFGIRPGDVEAVQKMGLENYLQQQLHPETLDDSAADQAVAQLPMMLLSDADLCRLNKEYGVRRGEQIKRAAQIEAQAAAAGLTINPAAPIMTMDPAAMASNPAMAAQAQVTALIKNDEGPLPVDPLAHKIEQLRRANEFNPNLPPGQLQQAKLIRAIDSNRQLQEVLVDFWSNHFNVDVRKDDVRIYIIGYDREAIRAHIWGSFHDLLEATAKSPAMLLYLDNASNVVPNTIPKNPNQAKQLKRLGGLNENYGREIMELHTLGVDAGYTQKDVQEVARCFTGWSFDKQTGQFAFHPQLHDNGPKVILGHDIPANGGIQDGETVLDILADSPQCAHFISKEMCQRFVSDDPAPALVDRIADVFSQTKGDLRAVTGAILTSPEFLSSASFGNKIKSPEEFTISAIRASGSTVVPNLNADLLAAVAAASAQGGTPPATVAVKHVPHGGGGRRPLRSAIAQLGEPLYNCSPPTGYKEDSSTWVNPGALIGRLNFAIALTETNVNDVGFDAQRVLGDTDLDKPDAVLDRCVAVLLQNKISDATRKVLAETAVPEPGVGKTVNPSKLIALILGSPEFQRK